MKKKILILIAFIIILFISFIAIFDLWFLFTKDKLVKNDLSLKPMEGQNSISVYAVSNIANFSFMDNSYQKDIDNLLFNKKNDDYYTASRPLLVINPYGTNLTGLYIYFRTFAKSKIEYTISVEDDTIPDFTNTLPGFTKKHEGQIIGLIQGMENTITLKVLNRKNQIIKKYQYKVRIPDYYTNSIKMIHSNILVDENKISDGLYMICNIHNSEEFENVPLVFYDRYGVLRAEFNRESGAHTNRVIFIDGKFFYSITNKKYALVNHLGRIEKLYDVEFPNNHDYTYLKERNSIVYIKNWDEIREFNLKSEEDNELIDLSNMMNDYYLAAKDYYEKEYNNGKIVEEIDWAHVNSIEIVNNKDAIISLRENSSIIYLNDLFQNPHIKYIIAPKRIYVGTKYEKYLLNQIGDFPIHAGQHTVIMERNEQLSNDQYYLYFFNNNYAKSETVVNDDWVSTIEGVGLRGKIANYSMFYQYLIDDKEKTFTLVDSFQIPYSAAKSNVQKFDGNYISTSGTEGIIGEYDADKNLLLELKIDVYKSIYRAYKTDMKNFWFGSEYSYTKGQKSKVNISNIPEESNNSDFYYNKKTNTILGVNSSNGNSKESNIIYYDNIYFTMYDYNKDTLVIPKEINGTSIKKITGINFSNVKKVIVEEGIEEIGDYAFLGMENLEEIILPNSLKRIGKLAFVKCNHIKVIDIPDSVTFIGSQAFKDWGEDQIVNVGKKSKSYNKTWKTNTKAKINEGE